MKRQEAGPFDIICGRGRKGRNHEGNRQFHELISRHRQRYKSASKAEKTAIVLEIMDMIHESGSRFLFKESASTDCYKVAEDRYVQQKVSHAFRDGHSMKREQKTSQEQHIYPSNSKRYDDKNNERVANEATVQTVTPLRIQRKTSEATLKSSSENDGIETFAEMFKDPLKNNEAFDEQEKLLELQQSIFSGILKKDQSEDTDYTNHV
mmetsp:Transcript_28446/g.40036  ORF Transcript_28446/g.40036 Transcript_28446/m.40036 type:complete len:208 (-) Transcript_28446:902-1525(-)